MNNEKLRIFLADVVWLIVYNGYADMPLSDWRDVGPKGQASIFVSEQVEDARTLGEAVRVARQWAEDSGFIVRPPKVVYQGNEVTMKLVRPS